jgi:type IV secretory pathway TrbF-like protein
MPGLIDEPPVIDEQLWREWVLKGKRQEKASIRRFMVVAGIAFVLLAAGSMLYLFAGK